MILYCFLWFYIVFIWFLGVWPKFSDDPFFWIWTFFRILKSTGNSEYHRNFRMTRFSEFERFFRISNVRPAIRTFDRKFRLPPKFSDDPFFFWIWTFFRISNVRPAIGTFDRKFQLPPKFSDDPVFWIWTFFRISNVRPEIRKEIFKQCDQITQQVQKQNIILPEKNDVQNLSNSIQSYRILVHWWPWCVGVPRFCRSRPCAIDLQRIKHDQAIAYSDAGANCTLHMARSVWHHILAFSQCRHDGKQMKTFYNQLKGHEIARIQTKRVPENPDIQKKRDIRKFRKYRGLPEIHENQEKRHIQRRGYRETLENDDVREKQHIQKIGGARKFWEIMLSGETVHQKT